MNKRDINQIEKPKKLEDSSIDDIDQEKIEKATKIIQKIGEELNNISDQVYKNLKTLCKNISNIMEVNKDESDD